MRNFHPPIFNLLKPIAGIICLAIVGRYTPYIMSASTRTYQKYDLRNTLAFFQKTTSMPPSEIQLTPLITEGGIRTPLLAENYTIAKHLSEETAPKPMISPHLTALYKIILNTPRTFVMGIQMNNSVAMTFSATPHTLLTLDHQPQFTLDMLDHAWMKTQRTTSALGLQDTPLPELQMQAHQLLLTNYPHNEPPLQAITEPLIEEIRNVPELPPQDKIVLQQAAQDIGRLSLHDCQSIPESISTLTTPAAVPALVAPPTAEKKPDQQIQESTTEPHLPLINQVPSERSQQTQSSTPEKSDQPPAPKTSFAQNILMAFRHALSVIWNIVGNAFNAVIKVFNSLVEKAKSLIPGKPHPSPKPS